MVATCYCCGYRLGFPKCFCQCPKVYDVSIEGGADTSICVPDIIQLSVKVDYIPSGAEVRWYSGATPGFNPLAGQGTQLASTTLLPLNFPLACPTVCPDLQLLYSGPCTTSGAPFKNEYVVISSGGGFFASDLRLELDAKANPDNEAANNSIGIGTNPCQIKTPDAGLINQLRTGTCNPSNLIPAGPGDYIPPGALVVLFLHSDIGNNIEFSEYCAAGKPIYILQNACERTLPAFSYNSTCTGNDRFVYQSISLKGCPSCFDELNYDLCGYPLFQSTYVVDNNRPLSSNANGGVQGLTNCSIPPIAAFSQPDTLLQIEVFLDDINDPLCGTTSYYKAVIIPAEATCPNVTTAAFPLKVECPFFGINTFTDTVCSGSPLSISLTGPPNARYTWQVDASLNVEGLSSDTAQINVITQTPIVKTDLPERIRYDISLVAGECASVVEEVEIVVLPPLNAEILGPTQFCKGQSATLTVNPGAAQVRWSTGESTSSILVNAPGQYIVTLSNGKCQSSDTIDISEVDALAPEISGDSLICGNGSALLNGPDGFDSYLWSTGSTSQDIEVGTAGSYTLEVSLGDCKGSGTFEVRLQPEIIVTSEITPPTCTQQGGSISLQVDVTETAIQWSNGQSGKVLTDLPSGEYIYNLALSSSCKVSDTLIMPAPLTLLPEIVITGAGCITGQNGSIEVRSVANSTGTVQYAFNGGSLSSINEWDNLLPGNYTIYTEDAAGCRKDTSVTIQQGAPLKTSLPDTIFVTTGSAITLSPEITGSSGTMNYTWSPADGLTCSNCLAPALSATENKAYTFLAEDDRGCRDSAVVFIKLEPQAFAYLPQAFSPNGDGINDRAGVLTSFENTRIIRLQIFNRFGEKVFEASSFEPGDIRGSWDGNFGGSPAPNDSYTYYMEVNFNNRFRKEVAGSILLIR
jgi:gliding motility-associated-like protein